MKQQQKFFVSYTSESRIRNPSKLFNDMWQDLRSSRQLAWQLLIRDLKAQYRQSLLGIFWAFVPSIAMAAGMTLASKAKVVNIGATDLPYPAYVMFSMALWQTFVESLNGPIHSVIKAKSMIAKIHFPREALLLSQLGQVGFNFLIKLILIVILYVWYQIPVEWTIILAPLALIQLIALGTSIGMLLAPLGALYQDISRGMTFLTGAWLFLTPVVYPTPKTGIFGFIVQCNPVTPLLVTTRELATRGAVSEPLGFFGASILSSGALFIAWVVFRLSMPYIAERMSA